ncbi:hypothetical protein FBQ82_08640 [Anaerolineae bacterium CFX7]|nr:hypothetical protein [Anaerolineae bacterium CFX7]
MQASTALALPAPHLGDGLFATLAGPPLYNENLPLLLNWLAHIIFFLMVVGDLATSQCARQDYLIVLRVGSRRMWWLGISLTIAIVALLYAGILLATTSVGVAVQIGWDATASAFFAAQDVWQPVSTSSYLELTAILFSLSASFLIAAGLVQTIVALYTRRAIWGFLVVLGITLSAWLAGVGGSLQGWQQWFPGTQSIVSRHYPFEWALPDLTLLFSLRYNAVLVLILSLWGLLYMRRFDLFGGQADE